MKAGIPERETFLHEALKWSAKGGNHKWGHPDLHKKIAQVFWRGIVHVLCSEQKPLRADDSHTFIATCTIFSEKNYTSAKQHFLYSKDGSRCAEMLVELHQQQGYSNEIDLFIAQAVLE